MIDPRKYYYLWTDHEVNYIFASCYMFNKFRQSDIVLIYDWKEKGLKFFLSRKDWSRYSRAGVRFYKGSISAWKKRMLSNIAKARKIIAASKKDKVSKMSLFVLGLKISERAEMFQKIASDYFVTESFFTEQAEKKPELSNNLREMGKIKFRARAVLNDFYNYKTVFAPYVNEVGRIKGRKDLQWLSPDEIAAVIAGKKVPVSKREFSYWVLANRNGWKPISGKKAKALLDTFNKHFFSKQNVIVKGTPANRGIYKGVAKVVRTVFSDKSKKEIKKVRRGDVLIAETTGPEMMLACQKAGAIVTDEGGLTSHAAVVSRELKIPCVVGTRVATKVFKDGDFIMVDANKGIVRKL